MRSFLPSCWGRWPATLSSPRCNSSRGSHRKAICKKTLTKNSDKKTLRIKSCKNSLWGKSCKQSEEISQSKCVRKSNTTVRAPCGADKYLTSWRIRILDVMAHSSWCWLLVLPPPHLTLTGSVFLRVTFTRVTVAWKDKKWLQSAKEATQVSKRGMKKSQSAKERQLCKETQGCVSKSIFFYKCFCSIRMTAVNGISCNFSGSQDFQFVVKNHNFQFLC